MLINIDKEKCPTYMEEHGLDKETVDRWGIHLYHGIRFDSINRLESIFQSKSILCGKKVNPSFISHDGTTKYIFIEYFDDENCNLGEYVSVMPSIDSLEFEKFVEENIFFAIKASVDALKTTHVSYDEYEELRKNVLSWDRLYSYAWHEYLVKDSISLDDVDCIGIDSRYHDDEEYNELINSVKKLLEVYKIKIPFKDYRSGEIIYCYKDDIKRPVEK